MPRPVTRHSWKSEIALWTILFIKEEAASKIPAHFEFDENDAIYQVTYRSGAREITNGKWITEHRVRTSTKRFPKLDYSGWTELSDALKEVHPNYLEYHKKKAAQSKSTTPVQEKAESRCKKGDHKWMVPYSEFDNTAFERTVWRVGTTSFDKTCCYFCGYSEIRKDEGGALYFPEFLPEKPDSIPEPDRWITAYKVKKPPI